MSGPNDTDSMIEDMVWHRLRDMTPADRAEHWAKLCLLARRFQIAGLHQRHPNMDREELRRRFAALAFGRDFAMHYFDWDPEEQGY